MVKATKAQIAAWRLVYETLGIESERTDENDDNHAYWLSQESHFESICVGWCMAKGMTLDEALGFYQQMIPLELF